MTIIAEKVRLWIILHFIQSCVSHCKKYCWFNLKNEVTWLP